MSLHKPFPSILDRPTPQVGERYLHSEEAQSNSNDYALSAIAESAAAASVHHDLQTGVVLKGYEQVPLQDGQFEPTHVHSTKVAGEYMLVTSQEQLDQLLATGDWSNTPLEVTKLKEV
jgi:hypothetical protein